MARTTFFCRESASRSSCFLGSPNSPELLLRTPCLVFSPACGTGQGLVGAERSQEEGERKRAWQAGRGTGWAAGVGPTVLWVSFYCMLASVVRGPIDDPGGRACWGASLSFLFPAPLECGPIHRSVAFGEGGFLSLPRSEEGRPDFLPPEGQGWGRGAA